MNRKLTVLLIEDDEMTRRAMSRTMRTDPQVTVLEASSLRDGQKILEEQTTLVAVVDLSLPDSSDVLVVERIRSLRPDIAIVVVTGIIADSDKAKEAGADAVTVKGDPDSYGEGLLRLIHETIIRRAVLLRHEPLKAMVENSPVLAELKSFRDRLESGGGDEPPTKEVPAIKQLVKDNRPGKALSVVLSLAALITIIAAASWSFGEIAARGRERESQDKFPRVIDLRINK